MGGTSKFQSVVVKTEIETVARKTFTNLTETREDAAPDMMAAMLTSTSVNKMTEAIRQAMDRVRASLEVVDTAAAINPVENMVQIRIDNKKIHTIDVSNKKIHTIDVRNTKTIPTYSQITDLFQAYLWP
jgi:flavin-binding protein dodecin